MTSRTVTSALKGTLLSWGLTALGSAIVFLLPKGLSKITERSVLDLCFGFAGGVMLAASFWSLLDPAIQNAKDSGYWGTEGELAWIPAAIGFTIGAFFLSMCDELLKSTGLGDPHIALVESLSETDEKLSKKSDDFKRNNSKSIRRVLMLVFAITVHNFPEGVAIGVAFGSADCAPTNAVKVCEKAMNKAWIVALGIGIQNIPEGLAVSLPLYRSGMSKWKSFFWGQLSGAVEPVGGILGAFAVHTMHSMLPYALSFAAGAMVYVVVEDLIAEAHSGGNSKLCTSGLILGFVVMMALDVGLG